ncbi:MAG: hypothetical protein WBV06_09615 [Acidimicrobiia bacterium]
MSFTGTGLPRGTTRFAGMCPASQLPHAAGCPASSTPGGPGLFPQLGGDGPVAGGAGLTPSPARWAAVSLPGVLFVAVVFVAVVFVAVVVE